MMPYRYLIAGLLALPFNLSSAMASSQNDDARAQELAASFRCLICEGEMSLLDDDNDLTSGMRDLIAERIAAGDTDEEIRTYFTDRYGSAILMGRKKP